MRSVTVYTKNDCVQCNYTKVHLEKNRIPYNTINLEDDANAEIRAEFERKGMLPGAMPIVAYRNGSQTQYWQGFHIDKIRGLRQHDW